MPCGRVHSACSMLLTAPVLAAGGFLGGPRGGAGAGAGCLAGIFLTPDLDQPGINSSKWLIIKYTFGLGYLWSMLWYPYAKCCHHRCWWSHFPIISTIFRLMYMGGALLAAHFWGFKFPVIGWGIFFFWSMGLGISDAAHWFLDFHSKMIPGLFRLTHPEQYIHKVDAPDSAG